MGTAPKRARVMLGDERANAAMERISDLVVLQAAGEFHPEVEQLALRAQGTELVGLSAEEVHDMVLVATVWLTQVWTSSTPLEAQVRSRTVAQHLLQQEVFRRG